MDKSNVVKLTGRDTITDPLTELLRTGAEQLIYQAVEAEFLELDRRRQCGCGGQRSSEGAQVADGVGAGHRPDSER